MPAQTVSGVRLTAPNDDLVWTDTSVNIGSPTGPVSFFAIGVVNGGSSTISVDAITINGSAMTLEADRSMNTDLGISGRWRGARLDGVTISGALTIVLTKSSAVAGRPNLVLCWSDQSTGVVNISFLAYAAGASFSASVTSNVNSQAIFAGLFNASVSVTATSPTIIPEHSATPAIGFLNSATELRLGALSEVGATSSALLATLAHAFTPGGIGWVASFAGSSGGDVTPPVITGPSGATGSTASIAISAGTTAVHTYTANEAVTWDKNGGANQALFAINSSTGVLTYSSPAVVGTHVVGVRATDGSSNATTQTLTVTVNPVSPTVVTHPATQTVVEGATVSFTAAFTGNPTPTVQWQRDGSNISGATSLTYSFTTALSDTGAAFRCVATNSGGSITTNSATLTVTPAVVGAGFEATVGPLGVSGVRVGAGQSVHWSVCNGAPGAMTVIFQGTSLTDSSGMFVVEASSGGAAVVLCSTESPGISNTNKPMFAQFVTLA